MERKEVAAKQAAHAGPPRLLQTGLHRQVKAAIEMEGQEFSERSALAEPKGSVVGFLEKRPPIHATQTRTVAVE